jgi:hypothetical protein
MIDAADPERAVIVGTVGSMSAAEWFWETVASAGPICVRRDQVMPRMF